MLSVLLAILVIPANSQPIHRDIVLVLDNSGSMRKNDPDFLTSVAVRAFINGLDGDDNVAIVAFDQQAKVLKPLAALDASHRAELLDSLNCQQLFFRKSTSAGTSRQHLTKLHRQPRQRPMRPRTCNRNKPWNHPTRQRHFPPSSQHRWTTQRSISP